MGRPAKCVASFEETPEFFTVFTPECSSKHLWIPPAFVRKFIPTTPEIASLKDHRGKFWNVAVVTRDNKMLFETGWEEFARAHFLEYGDLLLFKYNGDASFEVKIFGKNGCKKEVVYYPKTREAVKVEDENTQNGPSHVQNQTHNEKRSLNGSTKGPSPMEECRDDAREVSARNLAEQRTPRPANCVLPKNPYFVATITDSKTSQCGVYIPRAMTKEIKLDPDMLLLCRKDKSWPVQIRFYRDGRGFIDKGWPKFRSEHNLKADDKCVFELVLGKGKTCKQMKVRFIQGGARRAQRR